MGYENRRYTETCMLSLSSYFLLKQKHPPSPHTTMLIEQLCPALPTTVITLLIVCLIHMCSKPRLHQHGSTEIKVIIQTLFLGTCIWHKSVTVLDHASQYTIFNWLPMIWLWKCSSLPRDILDINLWVIIYFILPVILYPVFICTCLHFLKEKKTKNVAPTEIISHKLFLVFEWTWEWSLANICTVISGQQAEFLGSSSTTCFWETNSKFLGNPMLLLRLNVGLDLTSVPLWAGWPQWFSHMGKKHFPCFSKLHL